MSALKRSERLQIMLDDAELAAIDDWRFQKRMPSRAAAIRELLRRGLSGEGFNLADTTIKSARYGVLESAPAARRPKTDRHKQGNSGADHHHR